MVGDFSIKCKYRDAILNQIKKANRSEVKTRQSVSLLRAVLLMRHFYFSGFVFSSSLYSVAVKLIEAVYKA